mgnify:CR=1 FL=1
MFFIFYLIKMFLDITCFSQGMFPHHFTNVENVTGIENQIVEKVLLPNLKETANAETELLRAVHHLVVGHHLQLVRQAAKAHHKDGRPVEVPPAAVEGIGEVGHHRGTNHADEQLYTDGEDHHQPLYQLQFPVEEEHADQKDICCGIADHQHQQPSVH